MALCKLAEFLKAYHTPALQVAPFYDAIIYTENGFKTLPLFSSNIMSATSFDRRLQPDARLEQVQNSIIDFQEKTGTIDQITN